MTFQIRTAVLDDAPAIVAVHHATWQSETIQAERVAAALAADHAAQVAVDQDNKIVAYVDGFMTLATRWEVDLLAVDPAYRGQGLAPQLIAASLSIGYERGAVQIRALVAAGNTPAEQSFARCGFTPHSEISTLYVATGDASNHPSSPSSAQLVPVTTFTYQGIWVEGQISLDSLTLARWVANHHGWEIAGAVIPLSQLETTAAAENAGYEIVNQYRVWLR